jgi:hypothetical protein
MTPIKVGGLAVVGLMAIADVLYAMTDAELHAIPVVPLD